jgi:hypothetical protein
MFALAWALLLVTPAANEPAFEIRMLVGPFEAGTPSAMTADGTVEIGGKSIPGGSWYSIRRTGVPMPAWPSVAHAEFGNGDRLVGTVASADGDAIQMAVALPSMADQVLRFPLSSVRVLWLTGRPTDDPEWLAGPRSRDVISLRNGDIAHGALTAITSSPGRIRYVSGGSEQQVDSSKVAAVGFNTDLARARRPKGSYYRITLANGSRLTATALTFNGQLWVAQSMFKESLKIPQGQVVAVDVELGKAVHLSDLKPARYRYEPFDVEQFQRAADRNVLGRPLKLRTKEGESTFDRGLGLHAECAIGYALAGKYKRFECVTGLDARDGMRGDAVIEIELDGRRSDLRRGGRLTSNDDPLPIKLDVTDVRELTIRVRRGRGGHVRDAVNLVEARLIP